MVSAVIAAIALVAVIVFLGAPRGKGGATPAAEPTAISTDAPETSVADITGAHPAEKIPLAGIDMPILPEERPLADYCDVDCFKAFAAAAVKRFPEIGRVAWHPSKDQAEANADEDGLLRAQFVGALYYARRVKLADGQTLFDLITKCGDKVDPTSSAQWAQDPKTKANYVDVQLFPRFQMSDGRVDDLNALFERRGPKLIARSPFFSSHALADPDYMAHHGVQCVSPRAA